MSILNVGDGGGERKERVADVRNTASAARYPH